MSRKNSALSIEKALKEGSHCSILGGLGVGKTRLAKTVLNTVGISKSGVTTVVVVVPLDGFGAPAIVKVLNCLSSPIAAGDPSEMVL